MKKRILVILTALALLISFIIPSFTAFAEVGAAENNAALTVVTAEAEADAKAEKKSPVKGIIISIVIGLIIGAVVIASIKAQYKPVHKKTDAASYLVEGSYQLTDSYDNFIRTDKSQREINTNK